MQRRTLLSGAAALLTYAQVRHSHADALTSDQGYNLIDLQQPLNLDHWAAKNLRHWWMVLPGVEGGTITYDLVSKKPATLVKVNPTELTFAYALGAWKFNGTDSYIDIGEGAGEYDANATAFTWITALDPLSTVGTPGVIAKGNADSTTSGSFLFYVSNPGRVNFITYSGSVREVVLDAGASSVAHGPNQIAAGWKGSTANGSKIWVNGILKATYSGTTSAAIDDTAFNVYFGTQEGNSSNITKYPFSGYLNHIRYYNEFLSDAFIAQLYMHERRGFPGLINRVNQPNFLSQIGPFLGKFFPLMR